MLRHANWLWSSIFRADHLAHSRTIVKGFLSKKYLIENMACLNKTHSILLSVCYISIDFHSSIVLLRKDLDCFLFFFFFLCNSSDLDIADSLFFYYSCSMASVLSNSAICLKSNLLSSRKYLTQVINFLRTYFMKVVIISYYFLFGGPDLVHIHECLVVLIIYCPLQLNRYHFINNY